MLYEVRFWKKDVNIRVVGKYIYVFTCFEDAWIFAENLLEEAYGIGADCMDINNDFYPILT